MTEPTDTPLHDESGAAGADGADPVDEAKSPPTSPPSPSSRGEQFLTFAILLLTGAAFAALASVLLGTRDDAYQLQDLRLINNGASLLEAALLGGAVYMLTAFAHASFSSNDRASESHRHRISLFVTILFVAAHLLIQLPSLMREFSLVGTNADAVRLFGGIAVIAAALRSIIIVYLGIQLMVALRAQLSEGVGPWNVAVAFILVPLIAATTWLPHAAVMSTIWLQSGGDGASDWFGGWDDAFSGFSIVSMMMRPNELQLVAFCAVAVLIIGRALAQVRREGPTLMEPERSGPELDVRVHGIRTLAIVMLWSFGITLGLIAVLNGLWLGSGVVPTFSDIIMNSLNIVLPLMVLSLIVAWSALLILFWRTERAAADQSGFLRAMRLTVIVTAMTYTMLKWTANALPQFGMISWTAIFFEVTGTVRSIPGVQYAELLLVLSVKIAVVLIVLHSLRRWVRREFAAALQTWSVILVAIFLSLMSFGSEVMQHEIWKMWTASRPAMGLSPAAPWMDTAMQVMIGLSSFGRILLIIAMVVLCRRLLKLMTNAQRDHCLVCGYDLLQSQSDRCPECGTERLRPEVVTKLTATSSDIPRDDSRALSMLRQFHAGGLTALIACVVASLLALGQVLLLLVVATDSDLIWSVQWGGARVIEVLATIPLVFLLIVFCRMALADAEVVGPFRAQYRGLGVLLLFVVAVSYLAFTVPDILEHILDLVAIEYDFYMNDISPLSRMLSLSVVVFFGGLSLVYLFVMTTWSSMLRAHYGIQMSLLRLHIVGAVFGAILLASLIGRFRDLRDASMLGAGYYLDLQPERRALECVLLLSFAWWCWSVMKFARRARQAVESVSDVPEIPGEHANPSPSSGVTGSD